MTDSADSALLKGRTRMREEGVALSGYVVLDIQFVGDFRIALKFSQDVGEIITEVGGKRLAIHPNDDYITIECYRGLLSIRKGRSSRRGAKQIRIDTLRNKVKFYAGNNVLEEIQLVDVVIDTEQSDTTKKRFSRRW